MQKYPWNRIARHSIHCRSVTNLLKSRKGAIITSPSIQIHVGPSGPNQNIHNKYCSFLPITPTTFRCHNIKMAAKFNIRAPFFSEYFQIQGGLGYYSQAILGKFCSILHTISYFFCGTKNENYRIFHIILKNSRMTCRS